MGIPVSTFRGLTWILDDLKRLLDQTQLQPGFVSSLAQAHQVLFTGGKTGAQRSAGIGPESYKGEIAEVGGIAAA